MSSRGGASNRTMMDDHQHDDDGDDNDQAMLDLDDTADDDNAAVDTQDIVEKEDPLLLAIDDLEGRVVAAIDDVKLHPGIPTGMMELTSVHEELGTLLRPVLEVAAHTAPSIARTYYQGIGAEGIEVSVQDVYERVVSDLVLPVMLEMAQSDTSPAKRGAALEFFRLLWKESTKAGSWLDETATGMQAGPYGPGGSGPPAAVTPVIMAAMKRRQGKRLAREGEMLRYWVQASIACLQPGVFSNEESEGAIASRGIIAASASLRPSLSHIALRIKDADDRGANRLYAPVMKMVESVMKKLFLGNTSESILSACVKFLEIVILCCSFKPEDASAQRRRGQTTSGQFSLDDLPAGHPVITREALESIADYAFTTLRGLTLLGGQRKLDVNLLSDMMLTTGGDGSPSAQVVSILKPAALAFLEIETTLPRPESKDALDYTLDRSTLEFDFLLAQKSYVLTVNAMATLAMNRPVFFKDSSVCLARRTVTFPAVGGPLNKPGVLAVTQALKASCLTLLRNPLSVTTHSSDCLHDALKLVDMETQADKALNMARQATALKTAGRAARNRANMYYEWDADETGRQTKRQRETDDALAQMRAVKAARGLGHGIHLPANMTEASELVLVNLAHLPSKRPAKSPKDQTRTVPFSLDFLIDAILTGGASLSQEEGRWYERNGGPAFAVDVRANPRVALGLQLDRVVGTIEAQEDDVSTSDGAALYLEQCKLAAAAASSRILSTSSNHRSRSLADLGGQISARLAFTLKSVLPHESEQPSYRLAQESIKDVERLLGSTEANGCKAFLETYPLAAAGLARSIASVSVGQDPADDVDSSLALMILNKALFPLPSDNDKENVRMYDTSLELYIASAVTAARLTKEKPSDIDKRRAADRATNELRRNINKLPRLTRNSLVLVGALCDIDEFSKRATEALRKTSQDSVASSAAAHAAKVAADKRATTALLILRDAAFQRDDDLTRKAAVEVAVAVASGRLPSVAAVQENALKLVMNLLYAKNDVLASFVVAAATSDLQYSSNVAVASFDSIQKANRESEKDEKQKLYPLLPQSEEEKLLMNRLKHVALLYMALCVRKPDMIGTLFKVCSIEKADSLSKTVRSNMSTLAWAVASKHGVVPISLQVASMCGPKETSMLLSFLESLAPSAGKLGAEDDLTEACFAIQTSKVDEKGGKDPRFIIPVVAVMKRHVLIDRLREFVVADDNILLAALVRMCERQQRNALVFRDESDETNPALRGLTYCEQLVFLHQLDFAAAGIPQKRYLAAIKLCLEEDTVFTDRVVMAALEYMSGRFLTGVEGLPLAFMRTVILTCTKHESLQSWIANILLARLVEGTIYEDPRQWEGWMRCAHMLEKSDDPSANAIDAIDQLPPDQLVQYRRKWASK